MTNKDEHSALNNGASAQKLYDAILQGANFFLHNCSNFSVEMLSKANPTYDEIAKTLDKLVIIITVLSSESDSMMGQKAMEYCLLMKKMGIAIREQNQDALDALVLEMKRKPGT